MTRTEFRVQPGSAARSEVEGRPCVGCGYCCVKSPCGAYLRDNLVRIWEWKGCPELQFDGKRHWCSLVLASIGPARGKLEDELAIGAGCCSTLNSWRYEEIVDRRSR